jgi:hypothetical protein
MRRGINKPRSGDIDSLRPIDSCGANSVSPLRGSFESFITRPLAYAHG